MFRISSRTALTGPFSSIVWLSWTSTIHRLLNFRPIRLQNPWPFYLVHFYMVVFENAKQFGNIFSNRSKCVVLLSQLHILLRALRVYVECILFLFGFLTIFLFKMMPNLILCTYVQPVVERRIFGMELFFYAHLPRFKYSVLISICASIDIDSIFYFLFTRANKSVPDNGSVLVISVVYIFASSFITCKMCYIVATWFMQSTHSSNEQNLIKIKYSTVSCG